MRCPAQRHQDPSYIKRRLWLGGYDVYVYVSVSRSMSMSLCLCAYLSIKLMACLQHKSFIRCKINCSAQSDLIYSWLE